MDVSKAPRGASPLWIIALFIALSEATAGVAATVTDGASRLIFSCFAVSFPIAVFTVFVVLLIKFTAKLYPPDAYNETMTPETYNRGVNFDVRPLTVETKELFGIAMSETLVATLRSAGVIKDDNASDQVAKTYEIFDRSVSDSAVTVDISEVVQFSPKLLISISSEMSIEELQDEVYFGMRGSVPPYKYDEVWVLEDLATGTRFEDCGRKWARANGRAVDNRTLSALGISAGMHLKVAILNDRLTRTFTTSLQR